MALSNSKLLTNCYSTSFSLGIQALNKETHPAIYAIYGFVRLADEIVDTFHDQNKELLLDEFVVETQRAIDRKMSTNPVLHSFQWAVNKYKIDQEFTDAFIQSMRFDLEMKQYNREEFDLYVYGSAEVVGLMCLRVFCHQDKERFDQLKGFACKLGAAFQKINFLRDLKADYEGKGRSYFPNLDLEQFGQIEKEAIEKEIESDFKAGLKGIQQLPKNSKFGVYTAYIYYYALFKKISKYKSADILKKRIRISNGKKFTLLFVSYVNYTFRRI